MCWPPQNTHRATTTRCCCCRRRRRRVKYKYKFKRLLLLRHKLMNVIYSGRWWNNLAIHSTFEEQWMDSVVVVVIVVVVSQTFETWLLVDPLADQFTEHVYSTTIYFDFGLSLSNLHMPVCLWFMAKSFMCSTHCMFVMRVCVLHSVFCGYCESHSCCVWVSVFVRPFLPSTLYILCLLISIHS